VRENVAVGAAAAYPHEVGSVYDKRGLIAIMTITEPPVNSIGRSGTQYVGSIAPVFPKMLGFLAVSLLKQHHGLKVIGQIES